MSALASTAPPGAPIGPAPEPPGRGGPNDPSHDDLLRRGMLYTHVRRGVALALVLAFVALIAALPLSQIALEASRGEEPLVLDLFRQLPTEERLRQFEDSLEQTSYAKGFVQPRLQALLTRFGRQGNKKAAVGQDGVLYYVPGITHLAGPGFLSRDAIESRERAARIRGEQPPAADPRPAIFEFHEFLKRRGIQLVVFPVPDKAMLEPQSLHGRASSRAGAPVAKNRNFEQFSRELRARGIGVFDPTPERLDGARRFLLQDTHWTPRWMEQIARDLAAYLRPSLSPGVANPGFKRVEKQVDRLGDITDMLKLPEGQTLFTKEAVTIQTVMSADDAVWEPDPKSEVLLLGDSFTNVFSLDYMGWGEAAGFAPQLAFALGRGVDVIAQNDAGAHATRKALDAELRGDGERLAGKKVVVWEFAARELSVGDWVRIDWAGAPAGGP